MGLLRSRKPKDAATESDDVTQDSPLALAPDGDGMAEPVREEPDEPTTDPTWVRLGGDALWAGVLPDDALASLPSAKEPDTDTRADQPEAPADPDPAASDADPLRLAASRPQEPGSPEFRILCGAKSPDDVRRRFSWKTDRELAEAYELALEERNRVDGAGDSALLAYWDALVEASVTEAAARPAFGEVQEWDADEDRREQRQSARRIEALAKARNALLRSNRSS